MHKLIYLADGSQKTVHLGSWKRDKADKRDLILRSPCSLPGATFITPSSADNRPNCSPIDDQGQLGSCTGNMFAGIVEYNDIRWGKMQGYTDVARLFEYYATRKIEHTTSEDSGASIRDAIKAGAKYGVLDEASWPYDISKFAVNPPKKLWTTAKAHLITSYHRINDGDLQTMKATLASGYLIGFGFTVYSNMMSAAMAKSGVLGMPGPHDTVEGGHAVVLVGYDDARQVFIVRNSWGTGWGQHGYFTMPYAYIGSIKLANDFWVVVSAVEGE